MFKQGWKNRKTAGPLTASLRSLCPRFFLNYLAQARSPHRKRLFRARPVDFDSRSNPVRLIARPAIASGC